jgi:stage V sporulation protein B
MKKLHRFLLNALLLSAVAFFMKTVSVVFQVYIANRVGAEALGLYGLFSGIYGFAVTFATSGVHLAATRMTAEALGHHEQQPFDVRRSMRRCLLYGFCFGSVASIGLYLLTPILATALLDEPRVISSLRILSFALLPIALSSAMNGYFTACRRVYKNAITQVFEQMVRISVTVWLLSTLLHNQDPAHACIMLVLGSTVSEIASFSLSALFYLLDRKRYPNGHSGTDGHELTKKLCGIAIPVALSSYIRSGLVTLEHALIPKGLRKSGSSRTEALESYGILNSMVFPIIFFPTAIIGSFAGLLVPELAECRERGNRREIAYIAERVYSLALWFSIGISAILCCFAEELGTVIYDNLQAAKYIRLIAPLIPIMYIDTTTDAMLKGLGEQVYTMVINIADALISVILVWLLLPRMGIEGYILTIYIAEIFNAVCSIVRLLNASEMKVRVVKWVFKPLLCAVGATTIVYLLTRVSPITLSDPTGKLCLHIALSTLIYLLLLCGIHAIESEEFHWIRKMLSKKHSEKDT